MTNERVKMELFRSGVKQWQLSKKLEVSESQVTRMLRNEMDDEKQEELVALIHEIEAEKSGGAE